MFILVSPPDFSEELQLICGLDEARRRRFIAVVVADWLDRVASNDPGTAVSVAGEAIADDTKLDEFLYEYSFSREDVDTDSFYMAMAAYRSCCAPDV